MKDKSITIAKGIGIILVVLGHCGKCKDLSTIYPFINMFHMPLFFMISGFCFKEKYLNEFLLFLGRRVKGLYVPFVKYGLLFLFLHNIFYHLNLYNDIYGWKGEVSHLYSWQEIAHNAFFKVILFNGWELLIGSYWFLPQLFWASLLGWIVIKFIKKPLLGGVFLFVISLVFYWYWIKVPYTLINNMSFLAATFFCWGYALKKYSIQTNGWQGIVCALIVYLGSVFFESSMFVYNVYTILPFCICGICGTLMTMQMSRAIASSSENNLIKFLEYTGTHTLEIFTWHFLCFKLVTLIAIWVEGKPMNMLACFPALGNQTYSVWWVFYTIAGVGIPLAMTKAREYLLSTLQRDRIEQNCNLHEVSK